MKIISWQRGLLEYVMLVVLALLGNKISMPLFFGIDFIFGSIFVFLILIRFGFIAAVPASLIAASYTFLLWNHPYAVIIFFSETLVVGLLFRRQKKNLVLFDALYWIVIGIPFVFVFYGLVMKLPQQSVLLVMLKQGINGIFNAFIAFLIVNLVPLIFKSYKEDSGTISFRNLIFILMLFSLSFPALVTINIVSRYELNEIQKDVVRELNTASQEIKGGIQDWLVHRAGVVKQVADLMTDKPNKPSETKQNALELAQTTNPDFHNMYIADDKGRTTAFFPPINARGESTIGLDFSDRDYFRLLKEGSKLVISDIFMGRGGVFSPIVTISAPIHNQNEFNGFVLAALKTGYIKDIITRVAVNRLIDVTIVDGNRKVIASTKQEMEAMEVFENEKHWDFSEIDKGIFHGFRKKDRSQSEIVKWNNSIIMKSMQLPLKPQWTIAVQISMHSFIERLNRFYIFTKKSITLIC